MCGDKQGVNIIIPHCWGSPPRVRGKAVRELELLGRLRITPACAGKSFTSAVSVASCRDHPRVCGEKSQPPFCFTFPAGSPPRVRGKGRRGMDCSLRIGITPACAGKSPNGRTMMNTSRDHPRVCGDKFDWHKILQSNKGSPPRVRG